MTTCTTVASLSTETSQWPVESVRAWLLSVRGQTFRSVDIEL